MDQIITAGGIETEFTQEHWNFLSQHPAETLLYYDEMPRSEWLHKALMSDSISIEMDYDRVGSSKTGYVYRVYGAQAKTPFR